MANPFRNTPPITTGSPFQPGPRPPIASKSDNFMNPTAPMGSRGLKPGTYYAKDNAEYQRLMQEATMFSGSGQQYPDRFVSGPITIFPPGTRREELGIITNPVMPRPGQPVMTNPVMPPPQQPTMPSVSPTPRQGSRRFFRDPNAPPGQISYF